MTVDTKHPYYELVAPDWEMIRDTLEGQTVIRSKNTQYLPMPPGMHVQGTLIKASNKASSSIRSNDRYEFFKSFAEFPEIVGPALDGMQGILHAKPPEVELPPRMQYLIDRATPDGDTLNMLWENITREVMTTGRLGLLCEVFGDQILLCKYKAESIINWWLAPNREGGDPLFVVLEEVTQRQKEDEEFVLEDVSMYRVLKMLNGVYQVEVWIKEDGKDPERVDLSTQFETNEFGNVVPVLFGQPFFNIPLYIVTASAPGFDPSPVPMLPLSRRAISIYQKNATYGRSLYMKGDPTIVITGVDPEKAPTTVGGSSLWTFGSSEARATMLDIDGKGIPMQRDAINDEYDRFFQETGRLLDTHDKVNISGEAIRRRQQSKQVTLVSLAMNTGDDFEKVLKKVAVLLGEDPSKVIFTPNTDFAEASMSGQELLELITAKIQGAPISNETIHWLMKKRGLTNKDYNEEKELVDQDGPPLGAETGDDDPIVDDE